MKGLKQVAKESKNWKTAIFYDIETDTVNTKGKGYFVTYLIRECTEQEIRETIERWKFL